MKDPGRLLLLFLLILGAKDSLYGQSRWNAQYRLDLSVNGFFDADPEGKGRYTKRNLVIPGPSIGVGGELGYFLDVKNHFELRLGSTIEYRSFTRFVSREFPSGDRSKNKKQFRSNNLIIPLTVAYHSNKWSVQLGLASSLNLWTKFNYLRCDQAPGTSCDYWEYYSITDVVGSSFTAGNFMSERVYKDRAVDLQYTLGFRYQLQPNLSFGVEYRDFILANVIHYEYFDYDVFPREELKYQTNALYFSLYFSIVSMDSTQANNN